MSMRVPSYMRPIQKRVEGEAIYCIQVWHSQGANQTSMPYLEPAQVPDSSLAVDNASVSGL